MLEGAEDLLPDAPVDPTADVPRGTAVVSVPAAGVRRSFPLVSSDCIAFTERERSSALLPFSVRGAVRLDGPSGSGVGDGVGVNGGVGAGVGDGDDGGNGAGDGVGVGPDDAPPVSITRAVFEVVLLTIATTS